MDTHVKQVAWQGLGGKKVLTLELEGGVGGDDGGETARTVRCHVSTLITGRE